MNNETIRQKAEEFLKNRKSKTEKNLSETDLLKLIHELEVHQIELEMQNEELTIAKERVSLAEEELCKSEERFRQVIDLVPHFIFAKDINGKFIMVNQAVADVYGTTVENLIGKNDADFDKNKEEVEHFLTVDRKVIESGIKYSFEEYITDSKGVKRILDTTKIPFTASGINVPAVLGVSVDITERKYWENVLRESEERYRTLFQHASDGIFYLSTDAKVLNVNESFARMHGYTIEEMQGLGLKDLDTPNSEKMAPERIRRVMAGEILEFEVEHYHKDGHIFPLAVSTCLISVGGQQIIQAFHRDITENKKNENALKESESRFRAFVEQAPVAIGIFNLNGIGMYGNKKFAMTLGMQNAEDMIGKPAFEYFAPQFREESKKWTRRRRQGLPVPDEYESIALHPDGSEFPIHLAVATIQLSHEIASIAFLTDITERKRAENALKLSEEKFAKAFRINPTVIILARTKDAKVIEVNDTFTRVFGYTREDIIGFTTLEKGLWVEPNVREKLLNQLKNGISINNIDVLFYTKDKRIITCSSSFEVMEIEGDLYLLSALEDITDHRKAEQSLKESENKFRTLFNTANDATFIMNHTTFLDCNTRTEKIFRCSREQIIGHSPIEFSPETQPDGCLSKQSAMEKIESAFAGQPQFFEWVHTRLDGTPFYAEISLNRVFIGDEFILQAIVRDIDDRKKAEKSLRESEERFSSLVSNIPGVVYRCINDSNWTMLFISDHIKSLSDYPASDFINNAVRSFTSILHPDDWDLVAAGVEEGIKEKKNYSMEYRICHRDGTVKWVHEQGKGVFDSDGNLLWLDGVILDITERRLIAEAFKQSEAKYRKIVETTNEGVIVLDIETRMTLINKQMASMIGYTVEEMLGQKVESIMFEEDLEDHRKQMKFRSHGKSAIYERCFRRKDGSRLWTIVSATSITGTDGKFIGAFGMITDISARKAAEITIKESEEKYKSLFEANTDGIIIFRLRGDELPPTIIDMNENAHKMIGHTKEEMLMMDPSRFETNITKEKIDKRILELKTKGFSNFETTAKHKNGYDIYVEIKALVFNYKNEPALMNIIRDITERKQLENSLIIAKEKAEESDRLKSSFLHNMSHEVRTPLNAIAGFSSLMATPNLPHEKLIAFSQIISNSSDKLIQIITDVIEISQIHSNQLTILLSEIEIISFFKNLFDSFAEITMDKEFDFSVNMNIPYKEYFIQSDIEKLKKLIIHLFDNAIKFTHLGKVEINCSLIESLHTTSIQLSISDTGIGISEEMQKVIFEPFRQVEVGICRDYGGNGVGLSIAKAYSELLNGSISLKSEINKGTIVLVTIPVNKYDNQTITKPVTKQNYSINTILIVEDVYSNYKYLLDLLDETNLNILYASNGKQAFDMCKDNDAIDLVLMDIEMPLMDGYTATKMIKSLRPELPVIAQTAYALDSEKDKYKDVFDDYITKPIRRADLKEKLMQYIT